MPTESQRRAAGRLFGKALRAARLGLRREAGDYLAAAHATDARIESRTKDTTALHNALKAAKAAGLELQ